MYFNPGLFGFCSFARLVCSRIRSKEIKFVKHDMQKKSIALKLSLAIILLMWFFLIAAKR